MTTTSDILSAAMALPAEQRAEVAHELLLSLEPGELDPDVDQAWADEVRQRLRAIREGRAALRDWNDALEDIRQSLVSKGGA
ncbi:MAG: addiction module protein [Pirellulaceae bacterium]